MPPSFQVPPLKLPQASPSNRRINGPSTERGHISRSAADGSTSFGKTASLEREVRSLRAALHHSQEKMKALAERNAVLEARLSSQGDLLVDESSKLRMGDPAFHSEVPAAVARHLGEGSTPRHFGREEGETGRLASAPRIARHALGLDYASAMDPMRRTPRSVRLRMANLRKARPDDKVGKNLTTGKSADADGIGGLFEYTSELSARVAYGSGKTMAKYIIDDDSSGKPFESLANYARIKMREARTKHGEGNNPEVLSIACYLMDRIISAVPVNGTILQNLFEVLLEHLYVGSVAPNVECDEGPLYFTRIPVFKALEATVQDLELAREELEQAWKLARRVVQVEEASEKIVDKMAQSAALQTTSLSLKLWHKVCVHESRQLDTAERMYTKLHCRSLKSRAMILWSHLARTEASQREDLNQKQRFKDEIHRLTDLQTKESSRSEMLHADLKALQLRFEEEFSGSSKQLCVLWCAASKPISQFCFDLVKATVHPPAGQVLPEPWKMLLPEETQDMLAYAGIMSPEEILLRFLNATTGQLVSNWNNDLLDGIVFQQVLEHFDPFGKALPGEYEPSTDTWSNILFHAQQLGAKSLNTSADLLADAKFNDLRLLLLADMFCHGKSEAISPSVKLPNADCTDAISDMLMVDETGIADGLQQDSLKSVAQSGSGLLKSAHSHSLSTARGQAFVMAATSRVQQWLRASLRKKTKHQDVKISDVSAVLNEIEKRKAQMAKDSKAALAKK